MGGVFLKTLGDHARLLRAWALGCAAGVVLLALAAGRVSMSGWLANCFPSYAALGRGAVPRALALPLAGPAMWLDTIGLGLLVPLALGGFAVELGSRLLAGKEGAGELELLLAYPLRRGLLALEKLAALLTGLAALTGLVGLLLWAGFGALSGGAGPSPAVLAVRLGDNALLALAFGGLALAVSARSGRQGLARAAGLGGLGFAVAAAVAWRALPGWLAWTRYLSPLYWSIYGWALPLAALALLTCALALVGFEQRELTA